MALAYHYLLAVIAVRGSRVQVVPPLAVPPVQAPPGVLPGVGHAASPPLATSDGIAGVPVAGSAAHNGRGLPAHAHAQPTAPTQFNNLKAADLKLTEVLADEPLDVPVESQGLAAKNDFQPVVGTEALPSMYRSQKSVSAALSSGFGAGFAVGSALAIGSAAGLAVVAATARAGRTARSARVAARVAKNAPSLIQVLEQKQLLSTIENLKLLSAAENAGVSAALPEQLGLLKLADDLKLLTLAENILTDPSTPSKLIGAGAFLGGLTYLDVTADDFGFLQWVIAGALGAPALVLVIAGVAIAQIFSGAARIKSLDRDTKVVTFDGSKGRAAFGQKQVDEAATLLRSVEQRRILSFLENNRLLSLAAGLVYKPLTLTENLGVLGTLERSGLLSTVESAAADNYGGLKYAIWGVSLLPLAAGAFFLIPNYGLFAAIPLVLVAVVQITIGIVISQLSSPLA